MKYAVVVLILIMSAKLQAEVKIAIPPLEDMQNAAKEIRKQYEVDYSKASVEDKLALAEKLLKRAALTTESAAIRYVLFCEVMTLAAQASGRGDSMYFSASEGRGKTFVSPDPPPPDKAIVVAVKKSGIFQYGGNDYATATELTESLKKNVDTLNILVVTRDDEMQLRAGAQFVIAITEAGYSRLMVKDVNSNYSFIDDMMVHVGILEKALNEGIKMIAANKISDAMNEIRTGINCFAFDPKTVSADSFKALEERIAQEPDDKKKAALLVYQAVMLLSEIRQPGNPEKAIQLLNDAEKADPSLPEVYNTRGACCMFLKEPEKALPDFEKAVALRPEYPDAIENRSKANLALGRKEDPVPEKEEFDRRRYKLDSKIAEFTEALRLRPNTFTLLTSRARLRQQRGLLDEALSDFNSADKLFSNSYEVFLGRSSIFWQTGKLDQALANAQQALEVRPDSEHAEILCGLVHCENGDFSNAIKCYDAALVSTKNTEITLYDRAFVFFYQGDLEPAIEDCTAALKKNETFLQRTFYGLEFIA